MKKVNEVVLLFLGAVLLVGTALLGTYIFPWQDLEWGSLRMAQERTITVSGEAEKQEQNQIAQFSAGVRVTGDDKEAAVEEVNQVVSEIIGKVKNFGVGEEDIQTQNLSVHQTEDRYWDEESGSYKNRPGQWRVSNTIEVTLREVDKASQMADLLSESGATNVYGPNLRVDSSERSGDDLLSAAVADAREKAEGLASQMGVKLGRVIRVVEEGTRSDRGVVPMMEAGAGGGAPIEPGSTRVSKSVTVVFEIK